LTKILLVEDNSVSRKSIKTALVKEGFIVREAITGDQALAILKSENFALIITDLRLPDTDGFQLVRFMRELVTIPIICITAYYYSEKREAIKAGADDLIIKPFSMLEFVKTCKAQIAGPDG
jgi:DNA-binding response OmpR family regulator